jgi:hypothetical protein
VVIKPPPWASNPQVLEEMRRLVLYIHTPVMAQRLWERVLSDGDRRRLGGNLQVSYARLGGTAGMWKKLRGGSLEQAVLEVARELEFLGQVGYERLLRAVGKKTTGSPRPDRPVWNGSNGELRWKDRVIRRVRVFARPSNIHIILDEFERQDWFDRINNPLSLGQQQLHQALRSLNRSLSEIHFHAQEGGQVITWELT